MKFVMTAIFATLLMGTFAHAGETDAVQLPQPALAELKGIIVGPMDIKFQVSSIAGCSKDTKGLYKANVESSFGNAKQLTLWQIKGEACEIYQPFGETVTYTYKELGLQAHDQVTIRNKVTMPTIRVIPQAVR